MWDEGRIRTVLARALDRAGGQAEATIGGGRFELTRFAQNAVTQNVSEEDLRLTLRVIDGDRTGRASTNRLDDAGLADCVTRARAATRASRPVPGLPPLPGPMSVEPLPRHDAETAALTPAARADAVRDAVASCQAAGLAASGIYQTDEGSFEEYEGPVAMAIANTAGHIAVHRRTRAVFSITVEAGGSASGWAQAAAWRARDVDPRALTRTAIDKALASRGPVEHPPGEVTVLLEPEAVANLLNFLYEGFTAAAVDEGRSFLAAPAGERIAGDNVTLIEDARHPLSLALPFDREGVPRRRVVLVERGVHRSLVHSRTSAQKHGVEPTGHGLAVPSALDAWPSALVLPGTDRPFEQLVAGTPRAILVTRFWYCRLVDRKRVIVTGMTRDGTFLVEDGRVTRAVRNMRFNVSVLDVLRHVEATSRVALHGTSVVPGMRVAAFRFTSTTTA